MSIKVTSWSGLETVLQKEMYAAMEETVDKSFENLQENVDYFYDSPEGGYHRTGQLKASPQIDAIEFSGNRTVAQISINTGTQYYPAGRDTHTIYEYAEDGGLLGNGGFWKKTMEQIDDNIREAFGRRFHK